MIKLTIFLFTVILALTACTRNSSDLSDTDRSMPADKMLFDKSKWDEKQGLDYPFRDRMIKDVVHNDSIRGLGRSQILELLGKPDRVNENYLYYLVAQKRLGPWPLHTKSLVVKFTQQDSVEWIKIHE